MPTLTQPIFKINAPGLSFSADPQSWTIAKGVTVSSQNYDGVYANGVDSTLVNHGHIVSGAKAGVDFLSSHGAITNAADGSIFGADIGAYIRGNHITLDNAGTIDGDARWGVLLATTSTDIEVNNTGLINGHLAGVATASTQEGGHIVNSGTIHGDVHGIHVAVGAGLLTWIETEGTIWGGTDSVTTTSGSVRLENHGTLIGDVDLNAASQDDMVLNWGAIHGDVHLGSGNDWYSEMFTGIGVVGKIFGEAGNDTLIGGDLADTLNGGRGMDELWGAKGADRFDFDAAADSTAAARDVIADFEQFDHDRIDLATIDANIYAAGNQQFAFRGTFGFTHAGQIRYELHDTGTDNVRTIIYGNTDNDSASEFQIEVTGDVHFVASDFIL